MLQITPHHNIILSISSVDFRKGIDGLCAICRSHFETEPIEGAVFTNKRHISLKILVYDGMGFWLCIRRFSKGKLAWWPQNIDQAKTSLVKSYRLFFIKAIRCFIDCLKISLQLRNLHRDQSFKASMLLDFSIPSLYFFVILLDILSHLPPQLSRLQ